MSDTTMTDEERARLLARIRLAFSAGPNEMFPLYPLPPRAPSTEHATDER